MSFYQSPNRAWNPRSNTILQVRLIASHPHRPNWLVRKLTVELRLLEGLDLADVDVLHGVNALHSLEDLSRDVLGNAATKKTYTQETICTG